MSINYYYDTWRDVPELLAAEAAMRSWSPRTLWHRAWRDARKYGYVPTGLAGRGSHLDYQALEILQALRRLREVRPGAVVRAQALKANADPAWDGVFGWTAADYLRMGRETA